MGDVIDGGFDNEDNKRELLVQSLFECVRICAGDEGEYLSLIEALGCFDLVKLELHAGLAFVDG